MRTDQDTIDMMDSFLVIVEARLNRALDIKDMYFRAVLETEEAQGYYGLPSGFMSMRDIQIEATISGGDKITPVYVSPEVMNAAITRVPEYLTGAVYTIIANQIQIYPAQDNQLLEVTYRKRLDALSTNTPQNWLSVQSPDAYIFGLLVEINAYAKDGESAQIWESRFSNTISVLNQQDKETKWSGGILRINYE